MRCQKCGFSSVVSGVCYTCSRGTEDVEIKKPAIFLNRIADIFYDNREAAKDVIEERKLLPETVEKFKIGFSKDLLCEKNRDELIEAGLIIHKEHYTYNRFRQRLMFPIRDITGNVVGFGGRTIKECNEFTPKYLNSPDSPFYKKGQHLFGLYEITQNKKLCTSLILVEGYMDAITLQQAGFDAVASLGTALTQNQIHLLKKYCQKVYVAYDSDAAGEKAALRAIRLLESAGVSTKRLLSTPYKDPDELLKNQSVAFFIDKLATATPGLDYYYNNTGDIKSLVDILVSKEAITR